MQPRTVAAQEQFRNGRYGDLEDAAMAVKSTVFGGVILSGKESEKFQRQVTYGRPKKAASISARKGDRMRAEFEKTGCVIIRARKIA